MKRNKNIATLTSTVKNISKTLKKNAWKGRVMTHELVQQNLAVDKEASIVSYLRYQDEGAGYCNLSFSTYFRTVNWEPFLWVLSSTCPLLKVKIYIYIFFWRLTECGMLDFPWKNICDAKVSDFFFHNFLWHCIGKIFNIENFHKEWIIIIDGGGFCMSLVVSQMIILYLNCLVIRENLSFLWFLVGVSSVIPRM